MIISLIINLINILIVYGHIQLFFVKSTPHLNYQFKAVIINNLNKINYLNFNKE